MTAERAGPGWSHGDKQRCRQALWKAIRAGRFPHPEDHDCHRCGHRGRTPDDRTGFWCMEYHHYAGYALADARTVIPLCKPCHALRHVCDRTGEVDDVHWRVPRP